MFRQLSNCLDLSFIHISFKGIPSFMFHSPFSLDSTCCTPFNVASQKYGGSCLNQSSSWGALEICQHVIDGNISVGWNSSFKNESIDSVNSSITIGFHSIFVINKLRIRQNATTNQQIQEILLEFSDSTMEKVLRLIDYLCFSLYLKTQNISVSHGHEKCFW